MTKYYSDTSKMYSPKRTQLGLTMVELLVAIALQGFLLATISYVYVSSKQTYVMGSELQKVQNDGRYLVDLLGFEIRAIGYSGCRSLDELTPHVIATDPPSFDNLSDALVGYENGAGWTPPTGYTAKAGSDVLSFRFASGGGASLTGNMVTENSNLQIAGNPDEIKAGDLLIVSDCASADIFRASNVSNSTGNITIAHANNVNDSNKLQKAYSEDALLLTFSNITYFVDDNGGLYRIDDDANPQLLLSTIENIQFQYAVDTGGDSSPDGYEDATGVDDWGDVQGILVGILAASPTEPVDEPQPYTFNGVDANSGADRRLRKDFWSYSDIRNRSK